MRLAHWHHARFFNHMHSSHSCRLYLNDSIWRPIDWAVMPVFSITCTFLTLADYTHSIDGLLTELSWPFFQSHSLFSLLQTVPIPLTAYWLSCHARFFNHMHSSHSCRLYPFHWRPIDWAVMTVFSITCTLLTLADYTHSIGGLLTELSCPFFQSHALLSLLQTIPILLTDYWRPIDWAVMPVFPIACTPFTLADYFYDYIDGLLAELYDNLDAKNSARNIPSARGLLRVVQVWTHSCRFCKPD